MSRAHHEEVVAVAPHPKNNSKNGAATKRTGARPPHASAQEGTNVRTHSAQEPKRLNCARAKEATQGYPPTRMTRQRRRPHEHARCRGGSRKTSRLRLTRVTSISSLGSRRRMALNIDPTQHLLSTREQLWFNRHNSQRSSSSHVVERDPQPTPKK